MIKTILSLVRNRISTKKSSYIPDTDIAQVLDVPENVKYSEIIKKINRLKSGADEMFNESAVHYLEVGISAIHCIETAIEDSGVTGIK
jgi:hypothetical protein